MGGFTPGSRRSHAITHHPYTNENRRGRVLYCNIRNACNPAGGKVEVVAAALDTKNDQTNSTEVLPLLHDGFRTQAIKVLFEHKRELVVAGIFRKALSRFPWMAVETPSRE